MVGGGEISGRRTVRTTTPHRRKRGELEVNGFKGSITIVISKPILIHVDDIPDSDAVQSPVT